MHGAIMMCCLQLKDMVLKFSGSSNKQYKPTTAGSPSFRAGRSYRRPYPGSGFIDDATFTPTTNRPTSARAAAANSSSSATWDMTGRSNRGWPGIDEDQDRGAAREWMAQVEPGVQITFATLPGGGNDLKRIRFSREMFNKWEAQRWWGENYDRIVELYNVQTFSGRQQGGSTPTSSVDDSHLRDSSYSRGGSARDSPVMMPPPPSASTRDPMPRSASCKAPSYHAPQPPSSARAAYYPSAAVPDPSDHVWAHHFNMLNSAAAGPSSSSSVMMGGSGVGAPSSYDPSRATSSSRYDASVSVSNASDLEATEWIEQDEPGVCLTIRELGDGTRELRRIRFSRERFGEDRAKVWWEHNKDRIQSQYL